MNSSREVPGHGQRGERGVDRPNPATAIAGGEGGGAWKQEEVKAHLWVAWEVEGRVGARASTVSSGCWSSGHGDGVASAGSGRGRGVCELREVEAKLLAGSLGAERVWNGVTPGL